ncbi:repeat domain protein : Conserved repeat domain protein OS=Planctomyces brasiliensis (strain ATCC 49424 / DSM 5305 / JCM 21570 / NBRC 103401 / IFAM 1448) GN=Plabr_1405 PE=4 SV=1 [Gemmata massiliana]|uniref:Repeat domain protein: Conserved repeat domain protein n=1 Tax=Gemmata massiliana TaxID=1210884 RepID=A0A6P2CVQ3_9BACT|nr:DUF11 domain-containing protein [Gemmata massiliana]VTR91784.1 repeat domain protein : Conserved repeat domain protein OS=Planctomyces brasiliensis (strain ATCC 49424 / DSM 5305 / JCM 21570 / NBRC 103401 / IFAM 1448) GN=Plabr_1405 PE=4 SV=1 [Gemmata massiliana]
MSRWKHIRAAAGGGTAVVAVWAFVSLAASAQKPQLTFHALPEPSTSGSDVYPPLELPVDPNVEQAQFQQRVPGGSPGQLTGAAASVNDPVYPVVTIRVRVPADAVPGDDLKYVIVVQNVSAADAHSVTVRNPLSPDADVVRAEPPVDGPTGGKATSDVQPGGLSPQGNPQKRQLVWSLGTLKAGASKTIELVLRPKAGVTELNNLAYVKYEHGQSVTTKIGKPTVKVTKAAPKQTVRDETYNVRVLVENLAKVPADHIRVLENVPASAEVEPITAGGKRGQQTEKDTGTQQWVWEIARLQPGERKVIEYRVTPREAKEIYTLTSVTGPKLHKDQTAEAQTKVLVPGLSLKFTGPDGVVNAGESAKYEILVRNTGTLPSTALRVTGTLPAGCRPTKKTDGGQILRDSIMWQIPRLEPGEAQTFRYELKASTTGRRTVTSQVSDARGTRASQEVATTFAGAAALAWETKFDSLTVQVGKQGVLTVEVKNTGSEAGRNVRVQVEVPDNVSVVQTTPSVRVEGNLVQFNAESVPSNGKATYTLTFKGMKADQAEFRIRMNADSLGDRPLTTLKTVSITGDAK